MIEVPEYTVTCSEQCKLHARREVNDALVTGRSYKSIIEAFPGTNLSNLSRHRRHLAVEGAKLEVMKPQKAEKPGERVPHVQVLEAIIAAGWQNREKWRPTIGDTMKAMDMYQKITQGSAFQDLLDALASDIADDGDAFGDIEAPEAISEVPVGG